ncbi:hypothetical protein VTN77DRAFT_8548 [Rasamsonia byssochlamydoides]|uniref:uncharacterized protein n=1 Tax=Rasamsonia byssochlamydoides TaxID=89139 RepID=UPI0037435199
MYSRLIDRLAERAKIQRASAADAAVRDLASFKEDPPKAILITDPGVTEKKQPKALLEHLLAYVRSGGTSIFCCTFSSFIRPSDFNQFSRTKLDLPWEFGDYHRTTVHLNRSNLRARQILDHRPCVYESYSQKAVFLKKVDPSAAVYLSTEDSRTESHVFYLEKVDVGQTPVAFTRYGEGWLGYVGDVNTEEGSDEVILQCVGCRG